jgi:predicted permease
MPPLKNFTEGNKENEERGKFRTGDSGENGEKREKRAILPEITTFWDSTVKTLRTIWRWLRLPGQRRAVKREIDEELRFHIEQRTAENIAAGMPAEEAVREARRRFGNMQSVREHCREVSGASFGEATLQDLRFGLRMLRTNPGFTAVAVLTLALGIGANTAIFSVVNTLLLRSLPVKNPDELVLVTARDRTGPAYTFSYPLYERLRDHSHSLSGLFASGGVYQRRMVASGLGGKDPEFIRAEEVTGNYFRVLGVQPLLGRMLTEEDDRTGNPQAAAVISDTFWQRRFGADPSVIGRTIQFEDVPFTIVGVAPPGFYGIEVGENPDLWWPMQMIPQVQPGEWGQRLKADGMSWLRIMGRVQPGGNRMQAQAELGVVYKNYLSESASASGATWTAEIRKAFLERKLELEPGNTGWTKLRKQYREPLLILLALVGLVLLIVCANVASLMLARSVARQREFSVRSALGAGRLRLVRQLLTESLLLATFGSLLAMLIARGGTRVILGYMRLQENPISFDVAPDARVLWFTAAISLFTGLLFGLAPALQSPRLDLASALKAGAGSVAGIASRQRLNQSLVIVQVALSIVLLVGAGLMVRTLEKLKRLDAGFNRENVLLFDLDYPRKPDAAKLPILYKEILARLEGLPGVRAASCSTFYLLSGHGSWRERISVDGYTARPGEDIFCHGLTIGPRFFEVMGTPIVSGRDFGPQDEIPAGEAKTNRPATAIVNEAMARRYFGDSSPLGKHFHFGDALLPNFEIVGVVKDIKYESLRTPAPPTYYLSYFQRPIDAGLTFMLRTTKNSAALAGACRSIVAEVDPSGRTRDLRTMNDVVNGSVHQERVLAQLGGFFSLFALSLASLGLYGLLSLGVHQRTREIGVRLALGARQQDVLWLVIRRGVRLALAGWVFGVAGALAATRFIGSLLYGVSTTDPVTFGSVLLLLVAVAVAASWLPARRATKVDPIVALRCE